MSTFDERKKAFEKKFAHDSEIQFKVEARRNKMLGLWASDLLGKTEAEANDYVKEVIKADFQEAGDEDVYRKLAEDLGNLASEDEIREKISLLAIKAKDEIMNEIWEKNLGSIVNNFAKIIWMINN